MPEKRKWQAKCNQQSFDNPERDKSVTEVVRTPSPNRILSILGKNIGLLSRKHSRERQKKKYEEETQKKNKIATAKQKSSKNSNFSNILKFQKSKSNQINTTTKPKENPKNIVKDSPKLITSLHKTPSPKKVISTTKSNTSTSTPKQQRVPKAVTSVTITKSNRNVDSKPSIKPTTYKQNPKPKPSTSKPMITQKINSTKLKKSKSDSALNEPKGKTMRTSSAQSNISRASSSITSQSSSKSSTPSIKKKRKKATVQKKKNFDGSENNETNQAVVYTNYKHQVTEGLKESQHFSHWSLNFKRNLLFIFGSSLYI